MREWGFLGGSFDPMHFGHLNLAVQMKEIHNLEKVWICPAAMSPSKTTRPSKASAEDRYKMACLAIEDVPYLVPLDLEIKRGGTSYTIDTILALQNEIPKDVQIRLIIAEDEYEHFFKWKEPEKLAKIAPPLVATRKCHLPTANPKATSILHLEISSTLVRERLKKNLYCGHLVPHKVLEYIKKHKLYVDA